MRPSVYAGALVYLGSLAGDRSARTIPRSTASPAQLLALGDGRDKDDPEMAAAFARLDAACPESGEPLADIAVNYKRLMEEATGETYSLIYLMNQLSKLQEETNSAISCAEAAAASLTLMSRQRQR
jgi:hypothetical protein